MARVKGGLTTRRRHKKVLKAAKGYFGARSRQYKTANAAVMTAGADAYRDRRRKKRDFRRLWIVRINAAARLNGVRYGELMGWMKKAGMDLDRRVLADIALKDPAGFTAIVGEAKKRGA